MALRHGNPFRDEGEINALKRYLAKAVLYEGLSEISLHHLIGQKKPAALFLFAPLDCAVCINYMTQMRSITDTARRDHNLQVATIAFNVDSIGLASLAINWNHAAPMYRAKSMLPETWTTPFLVVLNEHGCIVFANAFINASEWQRALAERFANVITRVIPLVNLLNL